MGVLTWLYQEPKINTEKFTLKNYLRQTKQGVKQLTKTDYIKEVLFTLQFF